MEREFRKRLEREWRVIFSSNESIQRYFNEGKLFSRDARSRRERERDREINLGAIEIKILLNCCSFGRNMVETFVGDEKKKKICLYYHNWYRIGPVLYVHNTCIRIVFGFPSIRTLAIFNRYAKT